MEDATTVAVRTPFSMLNSLTATSQDPVEAETQSIDGEAFMAEIEEDEVSRTTRGKANKLVRFSPIF